MMDDEFDDLAEQIDEDTALGYMMQDRRLPPDQVRRLRPADWRGDDFLYLPEDLEWAVAPTGSDPGITTPKPSATPYFPEGYPANIGS